MKILGLGSNIGSRREYMRDCIRRLDACSEVSVISISPLYQSDAMLLPGSSSDWQKPFLNCALLIESSLSPDQMLKQVKAIEKSIGRSGRAKWAPREIDIDILLWDSQQIGTSSLTVPHCGLTERPFALLPLADLAAGSDFPGWQQAELWRSLPPAEVPFHTKQVGGLFPQWVAVINLTPDSFSDGGKLKRLDSTLEYCRQAIKEGAAVIDIGAESTRPGSAVLSAQQEWSRLEDFLPELINCVKSDHQDVLISLDTRNWQTAQKAVSLGIDWLNDVCGFASAEMQDLARESDIDLVVMHSLSIPPSPDKTLKQGINPLQQLIGWGEQRIALLESCGIAAQRLILDPGIGFGKTPEQNLAILKNASRLHQLGCRLLIGHSRKSFLKLFTDVEAAQRDPETAAVSSYLAGQAIDYLRVHNVALNQRMSVIHGALNGCSRWS